MIIENQIIETRDNLIKIIKDGVNPLNYIKDEKDIEFISKSITHKENSKDLFWDDMSELLLKSLIYYILAFSNNEKNLNSCKEIIQIELYKENGHNEFLSMMDKIPFDHPAKLYFKSISIMPEKTYISIFENLNEKLSEVLNYNQSQTEQEFYNHM